MGQGIRVEEAGDSVGDRCPVRELLVKAREGIAETPDRALLDALPEFLQAREPVLRFIAGDEACVDRADRGADDPVGLDAGLVQRLVDARLIGAERAAALQHQHDLAREILAGRPDAREGNLVQHTVHVLLPSKSMVSTDFRLCRKFCTAAEPCGNALLLPK